MQPPVFASGELASCTAIDTAAAVASGDLTAAEVLRAAVARAEEVAPRLGALTTAVPEPRGSSQGSLAAVPTVVKDLSELEGVRTTFGTLASGHHVSRRTSAPVRQLLATGLVPIGKSAAPEYGLTPTAETPGFPPTRNPWNLEHSVGGSSSGSAALVAAGVVPIAHATDGGGSIRIPAACTGLVGLKPTYGRLVEDEDMRGLPVKLVSHGVVTRTVADTAAWYAAAEQAYTSPRMPPLGHVTGPSSRRLRVALVTSSAVSDVDPEVVEATRRTGAALERLGHHVEEVDPPFPGGLSDDFVLYWAALAQGLTALGFEKVGPAFRPGRFDAWTRGLARHFRRNLHRVPAMVARLRRFPATYAAVMRRWDVLACPTVAILPPPLGWLAVDLPFEEHLARATSFVPFTPAWNISGAPAISLPMAISRSGLPIGVQLGGAFGDDRTLLEVAYELEEGFQRAL